MPHFEQSVWSQAVSLRHVACSEVLLRLMTIEGLISLYERASLSIFKAVVHLFRPQRKFKNEKRTKKKMKNRIFDQSVETRENIRTFKKPDLNKNVSQYKKFFFLSFFGVRLNWEREISGGYPGL